ncbi:MAG: hypothetical protein JST68_05905 [Bacteroidetes bacterium]|nr:hypothetical protein [Bacteroidota bacterium]
MSYDLYFFKKKNTPLTSPKISEYLTNHLGEPNVEAQWFFQNEATGVYFIIERGEPEESHAGFENTGLVFFLNFIRPSFFGLEAFRFIQKFITDLDLYVLNPQSDKEEPYKPNWEELFEQWDRINLDASAEYFGKENVFVPREVSNSIWEYNYSIEGLQKRLGDEYYVPRIYFLTKRKKKTPFTLTVWSEHIPLVVPDAEYFLLVHKEGEMMERTLISRETLFREFGSLFEDFDLYKGCKIIHPDNAEKAGKKFYSVKADEDFEQFAENVGMENVLNVQKKK